MLFPIEQVVYNIPSLAFWADAFDTPTGATVWSDKSGLKQTPVQATGGKQPTCTANQQAGKNAIVYTSANSDTLVLSSFTAIKAIPNGDSTCFIVAARTSEAGTLQQIFCMTKSGSLRYQIDFDATAGNISFQSRNAQGGAITNTGNVNTNFQIIRARRSGTTQALAVNSGAEVTDSGAVSESGVTNVQIGSFQDTGNYLNGSIAEIILYKRSLTTTEIATVENYLANKWGIP